MPNPEPVPFTFTKARAESLINCILTGKPIDPEDSDGWDPSDLISTAGEERFEDLHHCCSRYAATARHALAADEAAERRILKILSLNWTLEGSAS